MSSVADAAGLVLIAAMLFANTAGALWARTLMTAAKVVPLAALIAAFGPGGMTLIAAPLLLLGNALGALDTPAAGRAHLVAGLCAGALFASGPFGAVVTGATLSLLVLMIARRSAVIAKPADVALILFVPAVVIAGFAVAAQAQTGDPFALTADPPRVLSRLSAAAPQWPAVIVALAPLPLLGANALIAGGVPLVLLGGSTAALVTFGGTLDGIAEGTLVATFAAGTLPVQNVKSIPFAVLIASGACAIVLSLGVAQRTGDVPRPPYALWHIAPASLDPAPPWGIDHAR